MLTNKKKFTPFQLQVFEEIKKIPKGQVMADWEDIVLMEELE